MHAPLNQHLGHPITLIADVPPPPTPASAHQLKRLTTTHSILALFHITPFLAQTPTSPSSPLPTTIPPSISTILTRYSTIFVGPQQLPPPAQFNTTFPSFPILHPLTSAPTVTLTTRKQKLRPKSQACSPPALSDQAKVPSLPLFYLSKKRMGPGVAVLTTVLLTPSP